MIDEIHTNQNERKHLQVKLQSLLCDAVVSAVEKEEEYVSVYASVNDYEEIDNLYYLTFKTSPEQAEANKQKFDELILYRELDGQLLADCAQHLQAQKNEMMKTSNRVKARLFENYYDARIDLLESELDKRYSPTLNDEELPFFPDKHTLKRYRDIEEGKIDILKEDFEL